MQTTNVEPHELNYDSYANNIYDRDIVNAIPFHRELHKEIMRFLKSRFTATDALKVMDLGVGTGITAKLIQDAFPKTSFDVVDFSASMLEQAKQRLGGSGVKYVLADYSSVIINKGYDVIVSVIGMHHQNTEGKKAMFNKIYESLKPGGIFILGDLMTFADERTAALNHALHFHHLVKHAGDKQTLTDWAHHHLRLNDLATVEDQILWLKEAGFCVHKSLVHMNTVLLTCEK